MSARLINTVASTAARETIRATPARYRLLLIAIIALLAAIIALYIFRPDDVRYVVSVIVDHFRQYGIYYLLAITFFVIGWAFGRYLFVTYFDSYVILQVEDPQSNLQAEYLLSASYFETLKVIGGVVNPVSTPSGLKLYRCLEFNPKERYVRYAYCHDPSVDISYTLSVRELWEKLVKHDHDMTLRVRYLESMAYHETLIEGRTLANRLLDSLDYPEFQEGFQYDFSEDSFKDPFRNETPKDEDPEAVE